LRLTQPLLPSARTIPVRPVTRRLTFLLLALLGGTLLFSSAAQAQNTVSLVTLVTDQTPLSLSNHFGVPNLSIVNQAGDFAFIGEGLSTVSAGTSALGATGSALFLRRFGSASAVRLLQYGDPVPNVAGSTAVDFVLGGLNSSAHVSFLVDYTVSPPDGRLHRAILLYNGTTYSTVATSDQAAPGGTPGQLFGPSLWFPLVFRGLGGDLNDHDDVAFISNLQPFSPIYGYYGSSFYIAPAGGAPVLAAGQGSAITTSVLAASGINALGQVLVFGTVAGTTPGLYVASASGVTKVVANGDPKPGGGTFNILPGLARHRLLNDKGQVAFENYDSVTSTYSTWLYTPGAPVPLTQTSSGTSIALISNSTRLSNLGSVVGVVNTATGTSAIRIHSNGVLDTIASTGQSAPGTSGATFTSILDATTDNNDRASFVAGLSTGGFGLYQQTGTTAPLPVALSGQSTQLSGGGTFDLGFNTVFFFFPLDALDNGSTFFQSSLQGGAANFAEFLGTPTSLTPLMSTADSLPAGARVCLSLPASDGKNAQEFVGFVANLAGGQSSIFVKDIFTGVTSRILGEGDPVPGFSGGTMVLLGSNYSGTEPFYMNSSGQLAFPAIITGGKTAILLSGPAGGVTKVAATGDTAPVTGNPAFTYLDFNSNTNSLSPINNSGQVAFWGAINNGSEGIFLWTGSGLSKIAFSGDTVPEGGTTFLFFSTFNCWSAACIGVNSSGQVAFTAQKSNGTSGIYIGSASGPPAKVVSSSDTIPGTTTTFTDFGAISAFTDSGRVAFENVPTSAGVFIGQAGSAPTVVAPSGAAAPGTGAGTLSTTTTIPGFGGSAYYATNVAVDNSGNVVFQSGVTGGTADSGYFRAINNAGTLGPLQAAVLQGQQSPVPGAVGTMGTIFPSFVFNSFFSMSDNNSGGFAFTNSYTNNGGAMVGQFFSFPGGGIPIAVAVPGDAIPGTGGGVYAASTPVSSHGQNNGPRLYEVLTSGGSASQALVFALVNSGTVATSTSVVSSANPSGVGLPVTFTATVMSTGAAPLVGDVVGFFDNGVALGVGLLNGAAQATFTATSLSVGSHSITAEFFSNTGNNNGSVENLAPSTSAPLTQTVSNATTTLLFSAPDPSVTNQSVSFEAIVVSSVGGAPAVPTGTVTFIDGTTQIGTGALDASGVAVLNTASLSVGTHSITAQYPGDATFAGTTSKAVTQVVQSTLLPSATALASSGNPSFAGQAVTFTASVNGPSGGGTPTGNVNFLDNGVMISTSPLNGGVATFTTSSLSVGSHPVTAVYAGDANFSPSTSNVVTQTVNPTSVPITAPTFIALNSSPNPSAVDQSVLFTATVSSSATGTPTGTVTFLDNGSAISGSATPLTTGGIASYSTSSLSAGLHPITAQYSGNANFAPSMSSVLSQTVGSTSTQTVTVQITPIPQHVAPRSTCPAGGYCEQFGATVQNGGTNPIVTWQVLNGPGNIDSTGNYTALPSVAQGLVTISARVGASSASIAFVLGPDALTTSQTPATVSAGTPLSVPVQLSGVPPASTVPFILSCGSLPAATTCQFSNNSTTPPNCPMGTITFVTGQCPNFTVNVITTGGTSGTAAQLAPVPIEPRRPPYALFAIILPILALIGRRRGVLFGRQSYTCCVLLLLCLSAVFLGSCSVFPTTSTVTAPVTKAITPSGLYQVVVTATPGPNSANFVQTQLIVPITVN